MGGCLCPVQGTGASGTHHSKGWSKGWMLAQPLFCASTKALWLASSHTWEAVDTQWGYSQLQCGVPITPPLLP